MRTDHEFQSTDGVNNIVWTLWEPETKPVAVLQIIHGMSEHILRYDDFARYLNGFGIVVAGDDHLGHGRTAKPGDLGYFGEKKGWKFLREDEEKLHHILKDMYPDCKVSVLGHSMGSFILRGWMAKHGKNSGNFIIMGTCGKNSAAGAGITLCKALRLTKGSKGHSDLLDKMAFGAYAKRITNPRTPFDWLTTDDAIVDKYIDDPYCGFPFTIAGYQDLLSTIQYIGDDKWYTLVPKNRPILIVSGWDDPVGNYGKGPAEVCEKLRAAGCGDVSLTLFENMRHEILNEHGKEAVYELIKDFVLEA